MSTYYHEQTGDLLLPSDEEIKEIKRVFEILLQPFVRRRAYYRFGGERDPDVLLVSITTYDTPRPLIRSPTQRDMQLARSFMGCHRKRLQRHIGAL